jgi:WD40 repeat protein
MTHTGEWDFFVSYTKVDRPWAEWIAWVLEEVGYRVLIQAWDFVPGTNWIQLMQKGTRTADRTIAVLSDAYAKSAFGGAEWQTAWVADPTGAGRKLLVVRVANCARPGLLTGVVDVDLFGVSEADAKARLIGMIKAALQGRNKPLVAPDFPGADRAVQDQPGFPGGTSEGDGLAQTVGTSRVHVTPAVTADALMRLGSGPWRVFLSHTQELADFPNGGSFVAAAKAAVERAGHIVSEMASWTASSFPPLDICQDGVRRCEVFVGLIGFRYGTPVSDDPSCSYTEAEFAAAVEAKIVRLMFLVDEELEVNVPRQFWADTRHGGRQLAFRQRIAGSETFAAVRAPRHLETLLFQALIELSAEQARLRQSGASRQQAVGGSPRDTMTDNITGSPGNAMTPSLAPVFSVPGPFEGAVERPGILEQLVASVLAPNSNPGATTIGVVGAGGFGKTILARILVNREDVRGHFSQGIAWVDVGKDVYGPELAGVVNGLVERLTGFRPATSDPFTAGYALSEALQGRRILLVVDDVWTPAQVEPFLQGGPGTVRLITTRNSSVLPEGTERSVTVNAMTESEGTSLLRRGLPDAPSAMVQALAKATGGWPLLQALVNGQVRKRIVRGETETSALDWAARTLKRAGPAGLDINNPADRTKAVSATLQASLDLLDPQEIDRYIELAIFPQNVQVPLPVLTRYWHAAGGWDRERVDAFCDLLADSSLLADYRLDPPVPRITIHDVIREWLIHRARDRVGGWHKTLLDAHRELARNAEGEVQWWRLPRRQEYLWSWVPMHLYEAGLTDELRFLLQEPMWVLGKLRANGVDGLENDLVMDRQPSTVTLARVVRQNAHLLGDLEPRGSLEVTLASRLPVTPQLAGFRRRLMSELPETRLWPTPILPDQPHPALVRVLSGHQSPVTALVSPPNAEWLASADQGGGLRLWNPVSGTLRKAFNGRKSPISAIMAAPDGAWLVASNEDGGARLWTFPVESTQAQPLSGPTRPLTTFCVPSRRGSPLAGAGWDGTVLVWDPRTGIVRHRLTGHSGLVKAVAAAPDGTWLVSGGLDRTVRLWHLAKRGPGQVLAEASEPVTAVAVDPLGRWLAAPVSEETVAIWDSRGRRTMTLHGHGGGVGALVAAPDGAWLAVAYLDGTIDLRDPQSGQLLHSLRSADHGGPGRPIGGMVVARDGTWLAAAGGDDVYVWEPSSGRQCHALIGHTDWVTDLAAVNRGTWLATAGLDGMVRIWDPTVTTTRRMIAARARPVTAMATATDGTWTATGDEDGSVRVWGLVTGSIRQTFLGHSRRITALAAAPNGSWLTSAAEDGEVRVWGLTRNSFTNRSFPLGHSGRTSLLAITPDSNWLITAGYDGRIRVWDPVTGLRRLSFPQLRCPATALAVARDGTWLAIGDQNGAAHICDLVTGQVAATMEGHARKVCAIAINGDGQWMVTGGGDGVARLWHTSEPGHENDPPALYPEPIAGHVGRLTAVAIVPDGRRFATAGEDGTVRLWERDSGEILRILRGHDGAVSGLAFDPDGRWLVTAGEDRTVRVWDPRTGSALAAIRVDSRQSWVAACKDVVVAAGERGPYAFTFSRAAAQFERKT